MLWRPANLLMFYVWGSTIPEWLTTYRDVFENTSVPQWFIYSLPDGLWSFAYMQIMVVVWNKSPNVKLKLLFIFIIPVLGIIVEFLQFSDVFYGTGDLSDIALYMISIIIFCMTSKKTLQ